MDSPIVWFILIVVADITAMAALEVWRWYRRPPDIRCDLCGKVKDLKKTHDLLYWACKGCRTRYKKEITL